MKRNLIHAAKRDAMPSDGRKREDGLVVTAEGMKEEEYQPTQEGLTALRAAEESQKGKENEEDSSKDMARAMRIARNIMRGKIVPPQDEQFLLRFDDKLYQAAKNIASMKKQTKKVDSELDEEKGADETLLRELMTQADTAETGEASVAEGETALVSSDGLE